MNKQHLYGLINPFERIAGLKALLWGPAGIITGCCILVRLRIRRGGVMRWSTLPSG